jgi:carbon starvation protein CstA
MNALGVVVPSPCILAIAYRYDGAFIAAKVMSLDDSRVTPAHTKEDNKASDIRPIGRGAMGRQVWPAAF